PAALRWPRRTGIRVGWSLIRLRVEVATGGSMRSMAHTQAVVPAGSGQQPDVHPASPSARVGRADPCEREHVAVRVRQLEPPQTVVDVRQLVHELEAEAVDVVRDRSVQVAYDEERVDGGEVAAGRTGRGVPDGLGRVHAILRWRRSRAALYVVSRLY